MLYTEIIYSIRERLREIIDDSNIDDREIIFYVNNLKNKLYRNLYNQRSRIVDEEIKQDLNVTLELKEELCKNNIIVLKSKNPLPKTMMLNHKNAIFKISSFDVTDISFSLVSFNRFPYTGYKHPKLIYATVDNNNYLYLKSSNKLMNMMEEVEITLILENPLDIEKYDGTFDLDTFEYPLNSNFFPEIQEQVIQILASKLQIPEDKNNDSESR